MRITIRGTVQGVGFRPAVYRSATSLGIHGRVWNDGPDVVIDADGGEALLRDLMENLPPLARIASVEKEPSLADYDDFRIAGSEAGRKGVGIPTDTAICPRCLEDMLSGRRRGYAFTSCTDCGPRFTLLSGLPYDRPSTAMADFPMCPDCAKEYSDPSDRRFHHQTVCCPACGPSYRLLDGDGGAVPGEPVDVFAGMIASGCIGVAKSWGGMHICCAPESTRRMRRWYRREQKPFALMVRDITAVQTYGRPTEEEREQLESGHRPIVLVDKVPGEVTEALSPGLDNIGVFLPYTGMQHLLFRSGRFDALVMTSANVPGEPMITDDRDVLELGADCYLLHDQRIINRADDSVLRVIDGRTSFIRKSRGHIPSYLEVPFAGSAVGIGAQENLTASVAAGGRMYSTQHIGNGESPGVAEYLEEATRSLMAMTGCQPSAVAMDLHPGYINRGFGRALSEEWGCDLVEVQHHWAHAASLLLENSAEEAVVLSLDGTGYGPDGNAWGGEVLRSDLASYDRVAHLQYIPLLGSDRALHDIRRLKFAVDCMNGTENRDFDDSSAAVLRKLMGKSVMTSSMGRLLDTLAYALGVCDRRTYDGEPAMKMEPLLARGENVDGFGTYTERGQIMTAHLFERIDGGCRREDAAYSVVRAVIDEMVESARVAAESEGIRRLGITGGVSYNRPICRMFSESAKRTGLELIFHKSIPNGDGGISVGQAAVALKMIG
ncbi:MAG: carbamoyltransferase HypF [Candidatus Methanomethylophilaceae archaeon]|jgi:hydrogenase maturation protein HypF|nr:carbamoyltransferase HypF [Candidatus Methanomethylophilaceae archaeon]NLF33932.1 carbamoyltransferase HypF [Thermoplasmatales archaeon]